MPAEPRYRSTNAPRDDAGVDFATALLAGQAPDRGLYLPDPVPAVDLDRLRAARDYPEAAAAVLEPFLGGTLPAAELRELLRALYTWEVPVEPVAPRPGDPARHRHVLRLDRGPTASFKDFAAGAMGRIMGRLVRERGGRLVILTATSGDTGSAVAHAFHGVAGIDVVVLFPEREVTDRQRRQMTTLGGNVTTFAVDGKFDDCQALVKRAFADPELAGVPLSSANSINIGRLVPQAVYYAWTWARLAGDGGRPVVFSVPSGNFGNLCGGLLAMRAGVPVSRFVVATNANDEVPRFFESGAYAPLEPSRECISNAMNVGHPSNLARLVDLYGGWMDERGRLHRDPDMAAIRRDMWATSVDDAETRATIARARRERDLVLEPHGAVAFAGLDRALAAGEVDPDAALVSLETAHPAKFPEEVRAATGHDPEVPPALAAVFDRDERYGRMGVDYDAFRNWLGERFA